MTATCCTLATVALLARPEGTRVVGVWLWALVAVNQDEDE